MLALSVLLGLFAFAQERTVSGGEVDATGAPISRASVISLGSAEGISADASGNFNLKGTCHCAFAGGFFGGF